MRAAFHGHNIFALGNGIARLQTARFVLDEPLQSSETALGRDQTSHDTNSAVCESVPLLDLIKVLKQ